MINTAEKQTLKSVINRYNLYCAQGDVLAGYHDLKGIKNPTKSMQSFIKRVEKRFFSDSISLRHGTKIIWVREVLQAYAEYYKAVLTRASTVEFAEAQLTRKLSQVLNTQPGDLDHAEAQLGLKFERLGWHFLGGVTSPFRGPYIYEALSAKTHLIELPQGSRELTVHYMQKFHSISWLDFATFGKMGTGGWAQSDGLYCIESKYDTRSESFRVNYLKHEAQHVDDYIRFPNLAEGHQDILEFRAKLAELIYAESLNAFQRFMAEAKNDKQNAHVYAAYQLKEHFKQKLSLSEVEINEYSQLGAIKAFALEIYMQNTQALKAGNCFGKKVAAS